MESTNLEMDEIFDGNDDDDDIGATGVLPDLPEATQTQNEDEDNAEVLERLKNLSKGAAKKVVRKPQPKLDPTRLAGERGIPILPKVFTDVTFKGKGHEAQDLATLMRQMEHWAHRLFPKMPFDEVIERVEKLGSKNEVKTCIKKIRLDMPILDADFVGSDREDEDVVRRGEEEEETSKDEARAEDMWDELLREEEELTASQTDVDSRIEPGTSQSRPAPLSPAGTSQSRPAPLSPAGIRDSVLGTPTAAIQKASDTSGGFTPEQLERMEKNKQLAMERRLKKIGHVTPGSKKVPPQTTDRSDTEKSQASPSPDGDTGNKNEEQSNTVQGISKELTVVEDCEDSTQKLEQSTKSNSDVEEGCSVFKGDSESCPTVKESDKVQYDSAKHDSNQINNDDFEEMDTEMSEILEKGPSQNITVPQNPLNNAQNWHTGHTEGTEPGITFGSESAKNTETMEVDKGTVAEKDAEMSDVGANREAGGNDTAIKFSVSDSEMSEVIEKQDDVKVILKEQHNNLNGDKKAEEQNFEPEKLELQNAVVNSGNTLDKENLKTNRLKNNGKETETLIKEKVNQTDDEGSMGVDVEHFDEELTEDQMMASLES